MTVPTNRPVFERESIVPWIAASLLVMAAYVVGVVSSTATSVNHRFVLTVALCSIVTATHLVLARSRQAAAEALRAQRMRPAADELVPWASDDTLVVSREHRSLPPYVAGMSEYASAVVELLEHAVGVAPESDVDASELVAALDDAAALHDLLTSMSTDSVRLHQAAKLHTICSLWEADQTRLERAAAELDPEFHRRWRARNIATLRLRHGERPPRDRVMLPYRDLITAE